MNRVFDPIDIVFIVLISSYLIVLILIGLVLWYQKEKKDKMLLEMNKTIKENSFLKDKEEKTNKENKPNKKENIKVTSAKKENKNNVKKTSKKPNSKNNVPVRYKGKGPTKKKTGKRKKNKKTNGKNKKRK